jgi:hypothetical protein
MEGTGRVKKRPGTKHWPRPGGRQVRLISLIWLKWLVGEEVSDGE